MSSITIILDDDFNINELYSYSTDNINVITIIVNDLISDNIIGNVIDNISVYINGLVTVIIYYKEKLNNIHIINTFERLLSMHNSKKYISINMNCSNKSWIKISINCGPIITRYMSLESFKVNYELMFDDNNKLELEKVIQKYFLKYSFVNLQVLRISGNKSKTSNSKYLITSSIFLKNKNFKKIKISGHFFNNLYFSYFILQISKCKNLIFLDLMDNNIDTHVLNYHNDVFKTKMIKYQSLCDISINNKHLNLNYMLSDIKKYTSIYLNVLNYPFYPSHLKKIITTIIYSFSYKCSLFSIKIPKPIKFLIISMIRIN